MSDHCTSWQHLTRYWGYKNQSTLHTETPFIWRCRAYYHVPRSCSMKLVNKPPFHHTAVFYNANPPPPKIFFKKWITISLESWNLIAAFRTVTSHHADSSRSSSSVVSFQCSGIFRLLIPPPFVDSSTLLMAAAAAAAFSYWLYPWRSSERSDVSEVQKHLNFWHGRLCAASPQKRTEKAKERS